MIHHSNGQRNHNSRLTVFCDPKSPEVFYSVAHYEEIWKEDPFDVEEIHTDARDQFDRLLQRATSTPYPDFGPIMLIKGEAGSGKTHLMRAFRSMAHGSGRGYFGYMQMSSDARDYARYTLHNLITSLDHAYDLNSSERTSLQRLANSLIETARNCISNPNSAAHFQAQIDRLHFDELDGSELSELIDDIKNTIIEQKSFHGIDARIITALLYLLTEKHGLHQLAHRFLRGQDLSDRERQRMGDLVPMTGEGEAITIIIQLGLLMQRTEEAVLVICLDQLEDIFNLDDAQMKFRRAMTSVKDISDHVTSSVIVISCLEDYYTQLRENLTRALTDRIEHDPEAIVLSNQRTIHEIRRIISLRLQYLYESSGVAFDPNAPLYPFPENAIHEFTNMRPRDIIEQCRRYQEHWIHHQSSPEHWPDEHPIGPIIVDEKMEQRWNDFLAAFSKPLPESGEELAPILQKTFLLCGEELGRTITARVEGTHIDVDGDQDPIKIGLCLSASQGGRLQKEIEALEASADGRRLIIVRTLPFPKSPKAKISNYIGELIAKGARRVQIADADIRTMMAFLSFIEQQNDREEFKVWCNQNRPLIRLESIQKILNITDCPAPRVAEWPIEKSVSPQPIQPAHPEPAQEKTKPQEVLIGKSRDRSANPIFIVPGELTRHAAFMGGSGSGKTTLALHIIENLLLQGVPAILIDRKGDLCSYADPGAWQTSIEDPLASECRNRLREQVQVDVFTPGNNQGRPLTIPLIHGDMPTASDNERDMLARYAASALGRMMDYSSTNRNHKQQQVILQQAILTLSQIESSEVPTLDTLVTFINEKDTSLINAVGQLKINLFDRLVEDLETLRLSKGYILQSTGESLDISNLLLPSPANAKTRLTIISTKFLTDAQDLEFWLARFLVEMERWSSHHPSDHLQAVLLLDEADFYLPATRKPATKEPMENLLRRARSAGIGIFLASQSPGDFDYKCRDNIQTWFLGRIHENNAIAKLKPMLANHREDITVQIASQNLAEFYLVQENRLQSFRAENSLIKSSQVPEEAILHLARQTRNGGTDTGEKQQHES